MSVKITTLDANGDPIEVIAPFAKVEEAVAFCNGHRSRHPNPAPLIEGEDGRFFSLELMTQAESDHMSETAEYPPLRYWICGVDENGEDRELEEEDFDNFAAH